MKAVATALVLIVGAAVVLWYGNTLNSWVLGGLIGGLAALLLSIPISLTLFSYLARRHDGQLRAEAQEQEEISLAQVYEYPDIPTKLAYGSYEAQGYMLQPEEEWEENDSYRQRHTARDLSRLTYQQKLPSPDRLPSARRDTSASLSRQSTKNGSSLRGKDGSGKRVTNRRLDDPTSFRTQYHNALHTARLEAAQQYDDTEGAPTNITKRSIYPSRALPGENDRQPRSSRHLSPEAFQRRMQQANDFQRDDFHGPLADEDMTPTYRPARYIDPETEYLSNRSLHTGPVQPPLQSSQLARRSPKKEQKHNPKTPSGIFKRPLVRRAPYMYSDDPLRQELAQQIDMDAPIVRRSSRYEALRQDEEE